MKIARQFERLGQLLQVGVLAWLLAGSAHAVNLGGVRVLSQAGEPLKAEIGLTGLTATDGGTVQANLASPDIFAASGLSYPAVLDSVRIKVVRSGDGFALRLSSDQPVTDALLTPIIELSTNGGTPQLKSVSLAIPGGRTAVASAAPPPAPAAGDAPPWPVPAPGTATKPVAPAPAPTPAPAPKAAPAAPAPTVAAVTASVTEAIRQELKQQMAGSNDIEELRRQLATAQEKIKAQSALITTLETLNTAQQKIIDAQSSSLPTARDGDGTVPVAAPPAAAPDPDAPVVVTGEKEGYDPKAIIVGAAGAVLGLTLLWLAGSYWHRRRRPAMYLPAVRS